MDDALVADKDGHLGMVERVGIGEVRTGLKNQKEREGDDEDRKIRKPPPLVAQELDQCR